MSKVDYQNKVLPFIPYEFPIFSLAGGFKLFNGNEP